jgi:hypothetical protein
MAPEPADDRIVARVLRLSLCGIVAVSLGLAAWIGLVRAGVLPDPFGPQASGDLALARGNRPGLRVLFVGNSLTFRNAMPKLVERLAAGDPGAPCLYAVWYTAPGWTLAAAAHDGGLASLIGEVDWNAVVLQEQSHLLSVPRPYWEQTTAPAARLLRRRIQAAGAQTILFETWGYRDGDGQLFPGDTYAGMQARLIAGYTLLGGELGVPVAPVGTAWSLVRRDRPQVDLWSGDGIHPSTAGSYLAACVLYAELTGRSPAASSFTAGLPTAEATAIQRLAGSTMRERPASDRDEGISPITG